MTAITSRRFGGALLFASLAAIAASPASAQGLSQGISFPFADRPAVDSTTPEADPVPAALRRQVVPYATGEASGTIIIDTAHAFLYFTLGDGKALRYGIGVGRQGFTWSGVEHISRKAQWPDWIPPAEMITRQPYLPRWVAGGPGNPLGARALYLGHTDYRIHGTNDPASIGKHMSSGCIRLLNADVIDLYGRAGVGTKVIVLTNSTRTSATPARRVAAAPQPRQVPGSAIRTASRAGEPLSGLY